MKHNIRIQQENRKSLVMKVTPRGVVVLIPGSLDPDSPRVRAFVQAGLQRLPTLQVSQTLEVSAEDLRALVSTWSERIGVAVTRVQVRRMRTRWASCSTQGVLTLSTDLLRLPRDLVDYVICHDLVHLRIPDHGKGFRALMGCYMPDWRERERRLAGWVIAGDRD